VTAFASDRSASHSSQLIIATDSCLKVHVQGGLLYSSGFHHELDLDEQAEGLRGEMAIT
jgi:hypothetical protein